MLPNWSFRVIHSSSGAGWTFGVVRFTNAPSRCTSQSGQVMVAASKPCSAMTSASEIAGVAQADRASKDPSPGYWLHGHRDGIADRVVMTTARSRG